MSDRFETLAARIDERFADRMARVESICGELTYVIVKEDLIEIATALRSDFGFEMLIDVCAVDYLSYGSDEWTTKSATDSGFSRGVEREPVILDEADEFEPERFAVVYHLLSIQNNIRMRLRVYTGTSNPPVVRSVVDIWNSANWFEREAFDLYGILFEGHPDLRRILTDYGFTGHPFRKDFPLIGNVEVRYDTQKKRIVYEPVTIEPRITVPRVLRDDSRYKTDELDQAADARAEEIAAVVNRAFRPAIRAVDAADGSIVSFGGDAIFAVFTGGSRVRRGALTGRVVTHARA